MKRILVVNVNWMGDVIFSLPIFKTLKARYPQSLIACMAPPRVKAILDNAPFIDQVIVYDEDKMHRSVAAKIKFIGQLKKQNFDIAFLLHRSLTRSFLVFLAGIPERVGYPAKAKGMFLTHKVPSLPEPIHRSDYYLHTIESYGVPVSDRRNELQISTEAVDQMNGFLARYDIFPIDYLIVIHPGGNWNLKQWPPENFARLIDAILVDSSVKVVIAGGAQDRKASEAISRLTKKDPVVLTGNLTLIQLMALMKRADLVVSADSGPLHLAASLGTKTIGLFGPTRPEITGPRGITPSVVLQKDVGCNRRACYHLSCPDNICMQSVTVKDAIDAIHQIRSS